MYFKIANLDNLRTGQITLSLAPFCRTLCAFNDYYFLQGNGCLSVYHPDRFLDVD